MQTSRFAAGLLSVVSAAAVLASSLTPAQAATPPPGAGSGAHDTAALARPTPGAEIRRITLVTGDVAELTTTVDGKRSARLVGDRPDPFYLSDVDGELTLVPLAAYPLFSTGKLDRRLFNLTKLVAQGYDDASTKQLPVILTGGDLRQTPTGSTTRMALPSANATAVSVDKGQAKQFWTSMQSRRANDASKIWLDGRTTATLERSTKQIGAQTAWRSGYDGSGVKVAVLDTGYDANHPDLKQQVVGAESFIEGQEVQDRHGHGTHVASTIAGTGAASAGLRKGVAPGVDLLVGKVLSDEGKGLDSQAIAGMEWAIKQGAKVISMSLGGDPSDGSDPFSQAVDQLSQTSGALIVVAAGNFGRDEGIATPGTAPGALTVGAVDSDDKLAKFSSRGPRLGDGALKPEVTAPGVEIAAARAAGTEGGHQLGEYYTRLSGTSMATPHVAAAAAIVAQKHPDWTGQQLKSVLAGTAKSSKDVAMTGQGLGRIEIPKALDPAIVADTANLMFGNLAWTGTTPPPVERNVTFKNLSSGPQTLQLAFDVTAPSAGRAALTATPSKLTIAPGASATSTVRLDLGKTRAGQYAGVLVARTGSTQYRIGTAFAAGGEQNRVTVKAIDRNGRPAAGDGVIPSGIQLWNLGTGRVVGLPFDDNGTVTVPVSDGRYSVMSMVMGGDEKGWTRSVSLLGEPDVRIDSDRTFTFDARRTHPVQVKTPQRADPQSLTVAWRRQLGARDGVFGWSLPGEAAEQGVHLGGFDRLKQADGTFQALHRLDLAEPRVTMDVTGTNGFRLPTPRQFTMITGYQGNESLQLVDGGNGTPEELTEVRGKIAMIRWKDVFATAGQLQAAKEAGAKVVLVYSDIPGFVNDNSDIDLPVYLLRHQEAMRLRDLLKNGQVTMKLTGQLDSRYRYELAVGPAQVRGPLSYDFAKMRPAVVTTDFHDNPGWFLNVDQRTAYLPGLEVGMSSYRRVDGPVTRTDYLATDQQATGWDEYVAAGELNRSGLEYTLSRPYQPGEKVRRDWWAAISRPAIPAGFGAEQEGLPVARFEDAIRVAIPQHVNGDNSIYGWSDNSYDQTSLVLRRNGVEVGRGTWSVAQFAVPAATAWYDLSLDVKRAPKTWAKTSTATQSNWRFRSGRSGQERVVLPLVQVDYGLRTSATNSLPAKGGDLLELKPGYQPDARGPGWFRTTAEVSYDGGKTWAKLVLKPRDLRGKVGGRIPAAPAGTTSADLRVTATDLAGNQLRQTIEKAWLVE